MRRSGERSLIGKSGVLLWVMCWGLLLTHDRRPRPKEFVKQSAYAEDSGEEESVVGKMPPAEDSDEEA
jgi:hypothetical protein